MKTHYLPLLLVLLLQFLSCKNSNKEPPVNKIFNINADNNKNLIDLKLSDIADSFRLIPLETSKECLLGANTTYYACKSYIIAYSQSGVYKFSTDGKFIKKLFGPGRGPDEVGNLSYCTFMVDEKSDRLFIYYQLKRGRYLVYDLKAEHFLSPITQHFPGMGTFAIYNDSLIIGSPYSFSDTSTYAVYYQNLKGEFVSGITNYKKIISNKKENAQPGVLMKADSICFYNSQYDDTLFKIKDNKLIPYLALNFNTKRENPPNVISKKGDRFIFYQSGIPGFIIIQIHVIEDMIKNSEGVGDEQRSCYYLLFNNFTGKAAMINSYTDNFIGETQDFLKLSQINYSKPGFITLLPNSKIVVEYNPFQIKKAVEKGLDYKNFQDSLNKQLLKVNETMKETDNPVLLVGNLKIKL